MNFLDIQDEIINLRFNEGKRPSVKLWINLREGEIWSLALWPWRWVSPEDLAVTAGSRSPTMPSSFHRVLPNGLRDHNGSVVRYIDPKTFFDMYQGDTTTSDATDFTVMNGSIFLGPTPSTDRTYTISYERDIAHLNASNSVVSGPMSADTDTPIWDSMFHYILVYGAMITGLQMENDPTWSELMADYDRFLARMLDQYMPPDQPGNSQYGGDNLGYELASWL